MTWLTAIGRGFVSLGKWLLDHPAAALLVLLAAHVAAHQLVIDPRLRDQRDDAKRDLAVSQYAHARTIANYRAAARQAQQDAQANADRVKAEQDAATKEIVDDFQARLADARRRAAALELRAQSRPAADPGRAGTTDLPGPGAATGRADQAASEDRLLAAGPGRAGELTASDALIATEQALQLDALIDWVLAQAAIDTNAGGGRDERGE